MIGTLLHIKAEKSAGETGL